MKSPHYRAVAFVAAAATIFTAPAQLITSVTQVNGRTDRPAPQWTGQTFGLVNNSTTVISNYTVGLFGEDVIAMNDRLHEYNGAATTLPLPSYLVGNPYVMTANNNRAQVPYQMDITLSSPARAYLLVDNRIGDNDASNPPAFISNSNWLWIATDNWQPVLTGANRAANPTLPDEFGWDESGDGVAVGPGNSIAQYGSIYFRDVPAGTFSTYTMAEGRDMYGLVVAPIPEPTVSAMGCLGVLTAAWLHRRRR